MEIPEALLVCLPERLHPVSRSRPTYLRGLAIVFL